MIEDATRKQVYGERQRESLLLRIIGQMALPIEAAMDEENAEMLAEEFDTGTIVQLRAG